MMNDFNFLLEPEIQITEQPPLRNYIGPNLTEVNKMTPKQFASSVLEVYKKLGGATWLFTEAKANPRAFLELLKKMIPSGVQMEDLHGFSIRLIDQFGNQIELDAQTHGGVPAIAPPTATSDDHEPPVSFDHRLPKAYHRSGQPEIATGGNLTEPLIKSTEVKLQNTYD